MMSTKWLIGFFFVVAAISLTNCKVGNKNSQSTNGSTNDSAAHSGNTETGIEKVKPAPGKGNVQGKVFYNSKPVENIEVKLCETFNQYFGGCSGKTYSARTDKDGEYVITDVEPKVITYSPSLSVLAVKVF